MIVCVSNNVLLEDYVAAVIISITVLQNRLIEY